jgi:TPP-dependent pyruvate/acetoin dehydrogenase alpha subunit
MVLMVEANQWAFSTPTRRQTRVGSFLEKCPGYGIQGISVDGTDVLAAYTATRDAVERARRGEGTQMVELCYYRRKGHAQHDSQDYVDPGDLARWEARDPLTMYRRRLLEEGWAAEEELASIEGRARELVRAASDQVVEETGPDPEESLEGVWTDLVLQPPWIRHRPPNPRSVHVTPGASSERVVDPFRPEGGA